MDSLKFNPLKILPCDMPHELIYRLHGKQQSMFLLYFLFLSVAFRNVRTDFSSLEQSVKQFRTE